MASFNKLFDTLTQDYNNSSFASGYMKKNNLELVTSTSNNTFQQGLANVSKYQSIESFELALVANCLNFRRSLRVVFTLSG